MVEKQEGHLMSEKEAAIFLRISHTTLTRYRLRGTGPKFIKIANAIWYKKPTLVSWMDSLEQDPADLINKDESKSGE